MKVAETQWLVGTDLVWIPDVQESVTQFGERYLQRLFSEQERLDCGTVENKRNASLAARFAAKEAVIKILQPQQNSTLPWQSIEVIRLVNGSPAIRLHGAAKAMAKQKHIQQFSVSLSHEQDYACATVIAVCQNLSPKSAFTIGNTSTQKGLL